MRVGNDPIMLRNGIKEPSRERASKPAECGSNYSLNKIISSQIADSSTLPVQPNFTQFIMPYLLLTRKRNIYNRAFWKHSSKRHGYVNLPFTS